MNSYDDMNCVLITDDVDSQCVEMWGLDKNWIYRKYAHYNEKNETQAKKATLNDTL